MVLAGLTCDRLARRWGRYPLFWAGAAGSHAGGICLALSANVILTIGSTGLAILSAPLILGWAAGQFNIQNAYGLVILLLAATIAVAIWASRAAQKEQTVY